MYDTPIPKRFSKTPSSAVKHVYYAATGKALRTPKKVMLAELEAYCSQVGTVARIVCYRALMFRESCTEKDYDGKPHTNSTSAFALEEVLRALREYLQ